jgi:hypothetical protein
MRVDDIKIRPMGSRVELSARITAASAAEPFQLWYRFPAEYRRYLRASGSPFLAAMLMPAMALGEPLEIGVAVSAPLLQQQARLQDIFHSWWPKLSTVKVRASSVERAPLWRFGRRPSACFFSLGADSYYTLLENLDGSAYGTSAISTLLYVGGFDVRLSNEKLLTEVDEALDDAGRATGTKVLRVDTNLRDFTDRLVSWNEYHGSAMASVGIALERAFDSLYIASSWSYVDLAPWGSHPVPDPLWSTSRLEFIHDGCKFSRAQKISRIASVPVVQRTLRTCWENRGNRYNCGTCEKCLRTMAVLSGLGVLEQFATFPDTMPLEALMDVNWVDPNVRRYFELVLDEIPDILGNRELRDAIQRHLQPYASED